MSMGSAIEAWPTFKCSYSPKEVALLSPEAINCQRTSELGIEPEKSLPNSSHYFFNPHMIRTL